VDERLRALKSVDAVTEAPWLEAAVATAHCTLKELEEGTYPRPARARRVFKTHARAGVACFFSTRVEEAKACCWTSPLDARRGDKPLLESDGLPSMEKPQARAGRFPAVEGWRPDGAVDAGCRILVCTRNPFDTCVSLYHHARAMPTAAHDRHVSSGWREFLDDFLRGDVAEAEAGDWFEWTLARGRRGTIPRRASRRSRQLLWTRRPGGPRPRGNRNKFYLCTTKRCSRIPELPCGGSRHSWAWL